MAVQSNEIRPAADDLTVIREDHGLVEAAHESARVLYDVDGRYGSASYRQGYRSGWWDAVRWLLKTQGEASGLTDVEWLEELRKGRDSIYWPVFDADPAFPADCATCGRQRVFTVEGVCPECGWVLG